MYSSVGCRPQFVAVTRSLQREIGRGPGNAVSAPNKNKADCASVLLSSVHYVNKINLHAFLPARATALHHQFARIGG
jgi:hypothetical protein